jgi:hypothetical protein
VGPVYGVFEKDANLTVASALKSKIEYYISPVYMTRTIDTTVTLYRRAWLANNANDGSPVNCFISVHHNWDDDTSTNGTETYHCNAEYTDTIFGPLWRGPGLMYGARDSTFAKKVRLALRDSLQHRYRCSRQSLCGDMDCTPETGHKRLGGFGTDWYFDTKKGWCHESETEVQCGVETAGCRAAVIRDEQFGSTLSPV